MSDAVGARKLKINITDRAVKALKPPASGNEVHYDQLVPGFGARITRGGVVSFVLNYVNARGQERRYTFGRYPEMSAALARDEANRLRGEVRKGEDPLAAKQQAAVQAAAEKTIKQLAEEYMEKYARRYKRLGSVRNDQQMFTSIIIPRLGKKPVNASDVREAIEELHQDLKPTPYQANRVLALLSKMFALAVEEWHWRGDNPVKGIKRHHEERRDEWLDEEQLAKLRRALDEYPDHVVRWASDRTGADVARLRREAENATDALRLRALTGARERELLKARWDEINLVRGEWTKPSHHTKQKKTEHPPLNNDALALLKRMEQSKTGPYLFPAPEPVVDKPGGHEPQDSPTRTTLRNVWRQVSKSAGLVTADGKPLYKPNVLRHTFASHLVSQGESLEKVGALLGHTQPGTTARYAHLANAALRDTSNRFGTIWRGNPPPPQPRRRDVRSTGRRSPRSARQERPSHGN